jgi:NAD+ kinase
MGESLSSRVSYFGLRLDGGVWTKVKSSGLCVSTGTGSSSWHLSINRITEQSVAEVMKLLGTSHRDPGLVKQVTHEFNQNLMFSCGMSVLLTSLN